VSGGQAERREVTIGRRQPGRVELLRGVAAGERVVVEGSQKIRDGSPVSELEPSPAAAATTG